MAKVFLPSLQVMEIMNALVGVVKESEILERVADFGFYRSIETSVLTDTADAARFRKICAEYNIMWTAWASLFINGEGLNISSLDRDLRKKSIERLTELMNIAIDSGAKAFSILSGRKPANPQQIAEAVRIAADSMSELASGMPKNSGVRLLIEPLDRDVHKHGTIGSAEEAAGVIRSARREYPETYMVWDTSHMALQDRDLIQSLEDAAETVGHIHLCNAVLDPNDALYGDYHLMPGDVGYLDAACAIKLIKAVASDELIDGNIPIAIEARPQEDSWAAEEKTRKFLENALKEAFA